MSLCLVLLGSHFTLGYQELRSGDEPFTGNGWIASEGVWRLPVALCMAEFLSLLYAVPYAADETPVIRELLDALLSWALRISRSFASHASIASRFSFS